MEGVIRFHSFDVEKISYSKNKRYIQKNDFELEPQFLLKIVQQKENTNKFNIVLGVRVGINEEEFPYKAQVGIRGYFELIENIHTNGEELMRFLLTNGSAILFPYLRSILTDVTSKSDHNPIILPTLNFQRLIEKQDLQSLILTSDEYQEYE
ncbi:TPA: protein-export chaperone SecB [Bacillus pacificus]|uniref:protein-export chaperone SecB n=1 Tax=Bacillus pacificus TaxID=2026187 RepID=UPI002E1F0B7A|nr:protein-export chaperone SecB [Bacillus pacificus]HDR7484752.1 protein-export chaperone SecB [Bacillus pacificus]